MNVKGEQYYKAYCCIWGKHIFFPGLTIWTALLFHWSPRSRTLPLVESRWRPRQWCPRAQRGWSRYSQHCSRILRGSAGWKCGCWFPAGSLHRLPQLAGAEKNGNHISRPLHTQVHLQSIHSDRWQIFSEPQSDSLNMTKGFFWLINLVLWKSLQKSKQLPRIINWLSIAEEWSLDFSNIYSVSLPYTSHSQTASQKCTKTFSEI